MFLVRGSIASFVTRVVGVGLSYVSAVLISRTLGASEYGAYSIGLAWVMVLVLPSRAGLDFAVLRYGATYADQGQSARLKGLVGFAATGILLLSALIGFAAYLLVSNGVTSAPRELAVPVAFLIFPIAALGLVAATLRIAGRIVGSQFYEQVLRPLLLMAGLGLAVLASARFSPAGVMNLTAGSALLALLLGAAHAVRALNARGGRGDYSLWRSWLAVSIPVLLLSIVQELLNQLDIIMLGYLDTPVAAGHYSAAWRLASLVMFGLVALATVTGPMIATAHSRGDSAELARIARIAARLGFGTSLLLALVLIGFGRPILRLFGPDFGAAYPALIILVIGALTNAFTGTVAYLMTMTGRQVQALGIFLGALGVSAGLNLLLIPSWSIVGAAVASASATAFWNVAMLISVRRHLGIDASAIGRSLRRTLPAV